MANIAMANMNVNMAAAGNVSSLGTVNRGNVQGVVRSPQLQAMDKMSHAMTAPSGTDFSSSPARLGNTALAGSAKFEQGMKNLGSANSYLAECENQGLMAHGKSLSHMQADLAPQNKMTAPNAKTAAGPEKAAHAAQNPIGRGLDVCFGDKVKPSEKQAVVDFYGNSGNISHQPKLGAPRPGGAQHTAAAGQSNMPQNTAAAHAPKAQQTASGAQAKVRQQGTFAAPAPKTAPQSTSSPVKTAPNNSENNLQTDLGMPQDVMQGLRAEDLRFDFEALSLRNPGSNEPHKKHSVLDQYLKQSDAGQAQGSNTAGNVVSQHTAVGNLEMPVNSLAGFGGLGTEGAAGLAGGSQAAVNGAAAPKPIGNNPLDMVGTTAMSINKVNLEELVNMELANKFAAGFSE